MHHRHSDRQHHLHSGSGSVSVGGALCFFNVIVPAYDEMLSVILTAYSFTTAWCSCGMTANVLFVSHAGNALGSTRKHSRSGSSGVAPTKSIAFFSAMGSIACGESASVARYATLPGPMASI
jgi:hypothetical protein